MTDTNYCISGTVRKEYMMTNVVSNMMSKRRDRRREQREHLEHELAETERVLSQLKKNWNYGVVHDFEHCIDSIAELSEKARKLKHKLFRISK